MKERGGSSEEGRHPSLKSNPLSNRFKVRPSILRAHFPLFRPVWSSLSGPPRNRLALALLSLSWNAGSLALPQFNRCAPSHNPQTWKGSGSCWASQETLEKQQAEVWGQNSTAWHQVVRLWWNKQAQALVRKEMHAEASGPTQQLALEVQGETIWSRGRASTTCSVGGVHLSLLDT